MPAHRQSVAIPVLDASCFANATIGSLNIGGLNESHQHLFPETALPNLKIIEEKFKEYLIDEVARFRAIEYAWNKVNELYSFDVVKQQLLDVVDKYDG